MTTNDIGAIRDEAQQYSGATGANQSYRAHVLAHRVPALCNEIEQLRAALRDTLDELKDRTAERDDARRLAALTAEQEAANAQIIVDTRAERDAARAMADELRERARTQETQP